MVRLSAERKVQAWCTRATGLLLLLLSTGCPEASLEVPVLEREGDGPGECADEIDNDADGYFDCDDQDCERAPVCTGDDDDSGGGDDDDSGGGDDDDSAGPGVDFSVFRGTIEFVVDWGPDQESDGQFDCTASFSASGVESTGSGPGGCVDCDSEWLVSLLPDEGVAECLAQGTDTHAPDGVHQRLRSGVASGIRWGATHRVGGGRVDRRPS